MTSTPMVETIARAIYSHLQAKAGYPDGVPTGESREYCEGVALAALSAVSTPNEGMVEAGTIWASDDPAHVREIFTAMINHALQERP